MLPNIQTCEDAMFNLSIIYLKSFESPMDVGTRVSTSSTSNTDNIRIQRIGVLWFCRYYWGF